MIWMYSKPFPGAIVRWDGQIREEYATKKNPVWRTVTLYEVELGFEYDAKNKISEEQAMKELELWQKDK